MLAKKEMSALEPVQREIRGAFGLPGFQPGFMNPVAAAAKNMYRHGEGLNFPVAKTGADAVIRLQQIQRHGQQFGGFEYLGRGTVLLAQVGDKFLPAILVGVTTPVLPGRSGTA